MRFQKTIIVPSDYFPPGPDGKRFHFPVTPARIKRWAGNLQAMRHAGIRIPVAWGHQSSAKPQDADQREAQLAQFNAGYLDSAIVAPGDSLVGEFDVPGAELDQDGNVVTEQTLPDGTRVKAAIGEVSMSVNDWQDGKGKVWPDSIIHIALTPLPVWHGQDSFKPSTTGDKPPAAGEVRLSLSCRFATGGNPMAEKKPDEKPVLEAKADEKPPEKPAEEPEAAETPAPATEADEGTGLSGLMATAMSGLAKCGIKLPDNFAPKTMEAFLQALVVAIEAHNHTKEHYGIDDGSLGDQAGQDQGGSVDGGPPNVEPNQAGVMMSLLTHTDPHVRQMAERLKQTEERAALDKRDELTSRIDRLITRGLKPPKANAMKQRAGEVRFSLAANGQPVASTLEREVQLLEEVLPQIDLTKPDAELSGARVIPHPVEIGEQEQQAMIDRIARKGGKQQKTTEAA